MKNVSQAASTAAPTQTAYRRELMDLLAAAPVITTEEYERGVQNILACQDVATLQKWYRNCIREIARREEAEPVAAPVEYATAAQKQEITRLCNTHEITRAEKTKVLVDINRLNYAQAQATIGDLWAKVLGRAGASGYPAPPADGWSKQDAALTTAHPVAA